jgi:hypothetical protein
VSVIASRFAGIAGMPSQPVKIRIQIRFETIDSSPFAR